MKVAVPTFGKRVSPRFDCAMTILLATIQDGKIAARKELDASSWAPHERINRLRALGVEAVVCGGIDRWSVESLRSEGIRLYGWLAGTVEETLAALIRGELQEDSRPARNSCWRGGRGDDAPLESSLGDGWRGGKRHGRGACRRGRSDGPND